jgi:anti-anti-sigma factor
MGIQEWSDQVLVVDLADDPLMTDELDAVLENLRAGGPRDVLIDFKGVTFLNSSNIAKLLVLRKGQTASGRKLLLCELPDTVWSVFLVTGLEAIFEFMPSLTEGLAQVQMGQEQ